MCYRNISNSIVFARIVGAAPRRREITEEEKCLILERYGQNRTVRDIAQSIRRSTSVVHQYIKRYEEFGNMQRVPSPGRPKILSDRDLRLLFRAIDNDRDLTAR